MYFFFVSINYKINKFRFLFNFNLYSYIINYNNIIFIRNVNESNIRLFN